MQIESLCVFLLVACCFDAGLSLLPDKCSTKEQFGWSPVAESTLIAGMILTDMAYSSGDQWKMLNALSSLADIGLPPSLSKQFSLSKNSSTVNSYNYANNYVRKFVSRNVTRSVDGNLEPQCSYDGTFCISNSLLLELDPLAPMNVETFLKFNRSLQNFGIDFRIVTQDEKIMKGINKELQNILQLNCSEPEHKKIDLGSNNTLPLSNFFLKIDFTMSFGGELTAPFSDGPIVRFLEVSGKFKYHENEEWKMVQLPMQHDLSLVLFLPANRYGKLPLNKLESVQNITKLLDDIQKLTALTIRLPRITRISSLSLVSMPQMNNVQLKIGNSAGSSIKKSLQNSNVRFDFNVKKWGTIKSKWNSDETKFFCDQPFVFTVIDRKNQALLYVGHYNAPKEDEISNLNME